jgi:hypothetical protein
MKVCPKCGQAFNDDSLMYCLLDGTPLVTSDSQPTVVVERPMTVPKKNKTALWVGLVVVVMLAGIIAVAGLLMLFYSSRDDGRQITVNGSPSPRSTATPRSTQSPPASTPPIVEPSSPPAGSNSTAPNDEADEITPIAWTTAAVGFKDDVGLTYKFQCPEEGTPSSVWGSDIYTADSSICTAAVHAGLITLKGGGVVTIEFRPGRSIYGSTVRNGITTNTFGVYSRSFVVR